MPATQIHEMHVADALDNLLQTMHDCELVENYDGFNRTLAECGFDLIEHYPDAMTDACGVAGLTLEQVVDMAERLAIFVGALQDYEPEVEEQDEVGDDMGAEAEVGC